MKGFHIEIEVYQDLLINPVLLRIIQVFLIHSVFTEQLFHWFREGFVADRLMSFDRITVQANRRWRPVWTTEHATYPHAAKIAIANRM